MAERKRKKRRGAGRERAGSEPGDGVATGRDGDRAAPAATNGSAPDSADRPGAPSPRERMERGYARAEQRNQEARDALEPLGEGERPLVVTIGAVISGLIAASIVGAYVSGIEVDGERPRVAEVLAPTLLMGLMAYGMWRARYWAVLGFQLILVFLIFSAVFGLLAQAASVGQIAATLGLLAVSGTLFFFMVKAMARIQMPSRRPGSRGGT